MCGEAWNAISVVCVHRVGTGASPRSAKMFVVSAGEAKGASTQRLLHATIDQERDAPNVPVSGGVRNVQVTAFAIIARTAMAKFRRTVNPLPRQKEDKGNIVLISNDKKEKNIYKIWGIIQSKDHGQTLNGLFYKL